MIFLWVPLACFAVAAIVLLIPGPAWEPPIAATIRRKAAFVIVAAALSPFLTGIWLADCWRSRKTIGRWLYCHKPWLWVLNIAERRARRKHGMARKHPERIAYFCRKGPWDELQKQLWPFGEYVDEIEADMRERGWWLP